MSGNEVISKSTTTSGRSLLAIASLVISSRCLGFELKQLPLLQQSGLMDSTLLKLALPLLLFVMITHFANWLNDHNHYILIENEALLRGVREDLAKIKFAMDRICADDLNGNDGVRNGMSNIIGNFKPEFLKLKHPVDKLGKVSKFSELFSVCVQHFLAPMVLGCWAVVLTLLEIR